jgi:hypothetical protein
MYHDSWHKGLSERLKEVMVPFCVHKYNGIADGQP